MRPDEDEVDKFRLQLSSASTAKLASMPGLTGANPLRRRNDGDGVAAWVTEAVIKGTKSVPVDVAQRHINKLVNLGVRVRKYKWVQNNTVIEGWALTAISLTIN